MITHPTKLAIVFTGILIFAVIGVAWAQGGLPHVVPQQVNQIPSQLLQSSNERQAPGQRLMSISEIENITGFRLVLPKVLPEDCSLNERFAQYQHAFLIYDCVTIMEWKADGVSQPFVGQDSVENATVNGKPALYINGAWKTRGTSANQSTTPGQPVWDSSILPSLIFETNNVVVQLDAWGQQKLSKEDLLKIAESFE
jgi:hypothetical protein